MNLLQETIKDIELSGHKVEDIAFIGSKKTGHRCSWEEFEVLSDQDYYDGFGAQQVASDLIIVFGDGSSMWRHEYDGSEYWKYATPFVMPKHEKPIKSLFARSVGWSSLQDINQPDD